MAGIPLGEDCGGGPIHPVTSELVQLRVENERLRRQIAADAAALEAAGYKRSAQSARAALEGKCD